MEVRQLEAFVALATELHFGRAAERLHTGQPSLSDTIRRLERELGAPLFTRTTRRVTLTAAGSELLTHAKVILDDIAGAATAVRRVAEGAAGTVRLGITPPVAPVLAPYLVDAFGSDAPHVSIDVQRMWLPTLVDSIATREVDVAITCGRLPDAEGVVGEVFCAEPLQVAVRPTHRLAARPSVALAELAHDVRGATPANLFPAWALCQQQALAAAALDPPSVDLADADLTASRWPEQADVEWIMLVPSIAGTRHADVVLAVEPEVLVPFTLQWMPDRAASAAVARFVQCALTVAPPAGWRTQSGHRRHQA